MLVGEGGGGGGSFLWMKGLGSWNACNKHLVMCSAKTMRGIFCWKINRFAEDFTGHRDAKESKHAWILAS